jgi:hypothetical protein
MGKATQAARAMGATIHADIIDDFKEQLLIVLLKRLVDANGKIVIPVKEVDDTGGDLVAFSIKATSTGQQAFHFELRKKS